MAGEAKATVPVTLSAVQQTNIAQFQQERGIFSQDVAIGLLLDIAFEAVSGAGRRYWDKPLVPREEAPLGQVRALADRLREQGHAEAAERLYHATAGQRVTQALLEALREACQTVLTTIEALDPKTRLLAEELRIEVDKHLST